MEELDEVFSEGWNIVFNGFDVGFALPPIDVSLVETKICSFKNQLERDDEVDNTAIHRRSSHTCLKVAVLFFQKPLEIRLRSTT